MHSWRGGSLYQRNRPHQRLPQAISRAVRGGRDVRPEGRIARLKATRLVLRVSLTTRRRDPDRPGNNRLDGFRNIARSAHSVVVSIPGVATLRVMVAPRSRLILISCSFAVNGKLPHHRARRDICFIARKRSCTSCGMKPPRSIVGPCLRPTHAEPVSRWRSTTARRRVKRLLGFPVQPHAASRIDPGTGVILTGGLFWKSAPLLRANGEAGLRPRRVPVNIVPENGHPSRHNARTDAYVPVSGSSASQVMPGPRPITSRYLPTAARCCPPSPPPRDRRVLSGIDVASSCRVRLRRPMILTCPA